MSEARTRLATPDDALVVAALTLQCALHRGGRPEPGFLDRFAAAWARDHGAHPVWIAEHGGEHAGYLQGALVRPLPWPGETAGGGALRLERFFVRPSARGDGLGELLLRAAAEWARAQGLDVVEMRPGEHTRALCERVGLSAADGLVELRLRQA